MPAGPRPFDCPPLQCWLISAISLWFGIAGRLDFAKLAAWELAISNLNRCLLVVLTDTACLQPQLGSHGMVTPRSRWRLDGVRDRVWVSALSGIIPRRCTGVPVYRVYQVPVSGTVTCSGSDLCLVSFFAPVSVHVLLSAAIPRTVALLCSCLLFLRRSM